MQKLYTDIAKTGTVVLELEGVNPEGNDHYRHNAFMSRVIEHTNLQSVTLLDYPRPKELCVHSSNILRQLTSSPPGLFRDCMQLCDDLTKLHNFVSGLDIACPCSTTEKRLQEVQWKYNLPRATVAAIYERHWNAVLGCERGVFVELQSIDMVCPKGLFFSGSLRLLSMAFQYTHSLR